MWLQKKILQNSHIFTKRKFAGCAEVYIPFFKYEKNACGAALRTCCAERTKKKPMGICVREGMEVQVCFSIRMPLKIDILYLCKG